jgi:biotin carboxylase
MYDLNNKKLLIISSDSSDIAFVNAAKEMGVYVVCCDRYTDWEISPAKALADDAWDIDYTDIETVTQKCRSEKIDGVIAGYGEDRVLGACRISKAIGTPFYATEEQIQITRNKLVFKELCRQHGVLTPRYYKISLPISLKDKNSIKYPVIVKPSDNGGRKGISICDNDKQLDTAIELAAGQSKNNLVVVEDYIAGSELSAIYTLVDGEISLSCLNDKYVTEDQNGFSTLCNVAITPSKYYDLYLKTVDPKIKSLLRSIKAENGIATFQLIANKDEIFAFEMGYRINGNDDYKVIRKYNNIDYMKMLISYSLTGSMGDDLKKDNPVFNEYTCTLIIYLHGGTVGKIEYDNLVGKEGIDDICILRAPGTVIVEDGTNRQKSFMIKLSAKTLPKVTDLIHFTQANMIVEDVNGKNMLFRPFNTDRLLTK